MKALFIVGARPQFIKHAPLLKRLQQRSSISPITIHTGQHYDEKMSDIFFRQLGIPAPEYNLNIGSGSHGEQTGKMMIGMEKIIFTERPDTMIVYGDTNSTLAGALVASKLHISVIHIEAGLRSFDKKMPEEINRILTDHVSDSLLIPTNEAKKNLLNEGISENKICLVGDVMYDAFNFFSRFPIEEKENEEGDFALVTIHRAENTDNIDKLKSITTGLLSISRELNIKIPLHPRTRKALESTRLLKIWEDNFNLREPMGYLEMIKNEKKAKIIITDSGGVQKEAFFANTPCVTLRDTTEWVELIDNALNVLCPPLTEGLLYESYKKMVNTPIDFNIELYGKGTACDKIVDFLSTKYT